MKVRSHGSSFGNRGRGEAGEEYKPKPQVICKVATNGGKYLTPQRNAKHKETYVNMEKREDLWGPVAF